MTTDNQPKKAPVKSQVASTKAAPTQTPKPQQPKEPSKAPLIVLGVSTVFLLAVVAFAMFQNSKIKSERDQILAAYNETQVIPNLCQEGNNAICLYGKTTAVDDYLMILSRTLQVKPSTSYDIMLEVVPTKLAPQEAAVNTDCRPNNHHLYICQRMATSNPKKLIESLLGSYDNLNPNIEYSVSLILTPRATLIADDSQPQNMQMAPNAAGAVPQPLPQPQEGQMVGMAPVDGQAPVEGEAPVEGQDVVQQPAEQPAQPAPTEQPA